MVFGLCDDENEDLNQKIGEVFEHVGKKPRIEARRLGKKHGCKKPVAEVAVLPETNF